jgi:tRNA(fMet)-specific endonuclease VapC
MEPHFLLDTNICIYIRQERPEAVLRRFRKLRPGEAALERLRELPHWLPALPLPESAAEAYGTIRAELATRGAMIGNNDLWIAAHAIAAGLTLVTNNEKEFRRVRGLKLQNWAR